MNGAIWVGQEEGKHQHRLDFARDSSSKIRESRKEESCEQEGLRQDGREEATKSERERPALSAEQLGHLPGMRA